MTRSIYFYRNKGTYQSIDLDEVYALETAKNYVKFYTPDEKHIVRISMESAMKQLADKGFVQIHRYYAVAIEMIQSFDRENVYFNKSKESNLPITKAYYPNLVSRLRMLGEDKKPADKKV